MKHFDELRCESISGNLRFFYVETINNNESNYYKPFKTYVTFCPVYIFFLCAQELLFCTLTIHTTVVDPF